MITCRCGFVDSPELREAWIDRWLEFRSEAEERAYWETHTLSDDQLARLRPAREVDPRLPPPRLPK